MTDPAAAPDWRDLPRTTRRIGYSPAFARAICARIDAGESIKSIGRDPAMPSAGAIYQWVKRVPEFAALFNAAVNRARRGDIVWRRQKDEAQRWRRPRSFPTRPSGYSDDLAAQICQRLAAGESLSAIGRDPAMPCSQTVFNWLRRHPQFEADYALAREAQAQHKFDLVWDIAQAATPATLPVAREQIRALQWQIAYLAPTKWGARDPAKPPITIVIRKFGDPEDQDDPDPDEPPPIPIRDMR